MSFWNAERSKAKVGVPQAASSPNLKPSSQTPKPETRPKKTREVVQNSIRVAAAVLNFVGFHPTEQPGAGPWSSRVQGPRAEGLGCTMGALIIAYTILGGGFLL